MTDLYVCMYVYMAKQKLKREDRITKEVLGVTGIGRVVNNCKKKVDNDRVASLAKELVDKWKAMVAK